MIYLDSCLLVHLVESRTRADVVRARTHAVEGAHVAVPPLVVLECRVGPFRSEDEGLRPRCARVLDPRTVLTRGITVCERAARLRATHRLGTPDARHLAAALEHGCDELWTNDDRLSRAVGDFARVVGR
ncbi:MAG TPA: PIN domain-containing protein [Friedmanniella sp.]